MIDIPSMSNNFQEIIDRGLGLRCKITLSINKNSFPKLTGKMNFANNQLTNLRIFIQISVAFKVSW